MFVFADDLVLLTASYLVLQKNLKQGELKEWIQFRHFVEDVNKKKRWEKKPGKGY